MEKAKRRKPTRDRVELAKAAAQREFERFLALPDAQKAREAEAAARAKSRPLSAAERAMFDELPIGRRRGRPARGRGALQISVTMEASLLSRVDQFAQSQGMSRAQLIARGVEMAMKDAS